METKSRVTPHSTAFGDYLQLLPDFAALLTGPTPVDEPRTPDDDLSPVFPSPGASPSGSAASSSAAGSSLSGSSSSVSLAGMRVAVAPDASPQGRPLSPGRLSLGDPLAPSTPPKPLPALHPAVAPSADDMLDMISEAFGERRDTLIRSAVATSLQGYAAASSLEARADALRLGLRCLQLSPGCSSTRYAPGSLTPSAEIERARKACALAQALLPAVAACVSDPAWSASTSSFLRERLLSAWFAVAHMALVALHPVKDAAARALAGRQVAGLLEAGELACGAPSPAEAAAGHGHNYQRHKLWLLAPDHGKWISRREVHLVFDSLPPTARFRQAYLESLGLTLAQLLQPAPKVEEAPVDPMAALLADPFAPVEYALPADPKARLDLLQKRLLRVCPNGIGEQDEQALARYSGVPGPGLAIGRLLGEPEAELAAPAALDAARVTGMRWREVAETLGPFLSLDLIRLCQSYLGGWGATWLARPLAVEPPPPQTRDDDAAPPAEAPSMVASPPAPSWPRTLSFAGRRLAVDLLATSGPTAVVRVADPVIANWLCSDPLALQYDVAPSRSYGVGALSVPMRWLSVPASESVTA